MSAFKQAKVHARQLRQKLSPPEVRFWLRVRERVAGQPVFRRQHPFGPYVLDFYCPKARLAIEIDGLGHDMGDRPRRDMRRDAWLKQHGVTVFRVPASDLLQNFDDTADAIVRMAADMCLRPVRDRESVRPED